MKHAGSAFDPPAALVETTEAPVPAVARAIGDWAAGLWDREQG